MARSAFIEEPVAVKGTPGWLEMAAAPMEWLPKVDGYNLSYLRPGATQAAVTGDEYAAPLGGLLAARRGPGGGGVVPHGRRFFPADARLEKLRRVSPRVSRAGSWASRCRQESACAPRWTAACSRRICFTTKPGIDRIAAHAPELVLAEGADGKAAPGAWERLAPGHFRATLDVDGETYLRGAVKIGDAAFPFGPVNAVTNPEWSFDQGATG